MGRISKTEVQRAALATLVGLAPAMGLAQEVIDWRGYRIDPNADVAETVPLDLRIEAFAIDEPGYYFIQFDGPITEEMKAAATEAGATLLTYAPPNTFIARLSPEDREAVDALDLVIWTGIYQPAFRVDAPVAELARTGAVPQPETPPLDPVRPMMPIPEALRPEPARTVTLNVELFPGEDAGPLADRIAETGGTVASISASDRGSTLRVIVDPETVPAIAAQSGVEWMHVEELPRLHNDTGRVVIGIPPVEAAPLGLTGAGQVVAVADSGLDTGVNNATMHDDVEGRIDAIFSWPTGVFNSDCGVITNGGADDGAADLDSGHGTHVTGSVLGDGTASAGTLAGAAPGARLVMQAVEQFGDYPGVNCDGYGLLGIPADLNDLFQQAYDAGARIHTNSWGAPVNGAYDANAQEADNFVWDNPDMLILFSAGNSGVDTDGNNVVDANSIGSPGTAKNVLTVGASENDRPTLQQTYNASYAPVIDADAITSDPDGLAAFSSRGPVQNNRRKPDLVAPGTLVTSIRSSAAPNTLWFDDDVEGGPNGWVGTGGWTQTNVDANSATMSWTDSPAGNHGQNQNVTLTSGNINVSGGGLGAKALRFFHRYDMGAGDSWTLQVSPDGGASWGGIPPIEGTQANWELFTIGLPEPFASATNLRVRFRLQSNGDADVGDGLWIDDIQVVEGAFLTALRSDMGLTAEGSAEDMAYLMSNGTSMSTPLTAGAAALVREYFTDTLGLDYVSAALLRATLINGATDPAPGQYGTGANQEIQPGPNNASGWGRVNVAGAIAPTAPSVRNHVDELAGLATGESRTYELAVTDASVPVSITMAYHDFPGASIVNNLDMTVTAPDASVISAADALNNIERVRIAAADVQVGTYTITIDGQNVPQGPQPFALASVAGGTLVDRQPVDAMLVLDMSGSMGLPACPGCPSKLSVLKDSVELFAQLWSAVSVPTDRLGVAYFDSTIDEFDVGGTVLLEVDTNLQAIVADALSQSASGSTAMGGGLQQAIGRLTSMRPRNIILFTDGIQNRNPMVREVGGQLEISDEPGRPGSNVNPTVPPTALDVALDRGVNTIGIGATPPFVELLSDIADATDGVAKLTTAPDNDLRRFFVEELIDVLRTGSPQLIGYRDGRLRDDVIEETFEVNASARQVVLKLSWQRGTEMKLEVFKDGVDLGQVTKPIQGAFYTIFSLDLDDLARAGVPVEGAYVMRITGEPRARYEVAAIAEEPTLDYDFDVRSESGAVGDVLRLRARLTEGLAPFGGEARVTARILRPREGMGTLLSILKPSGEPIDQFERGTTPGQVKFERLLLDPEFRERIQPIEDRIVLRQTRPGIFEATYPRTDVPGVYTVAFLLEGKSETVGTFRRTELVSEALEVGPIDPDRSEIQVRVGSRGRDQQTVDIRLRPADKRGNLLGPDYGDRIEVRVGKVLVERLEDRLDGSYAARVPIPAGTDPVVTIRIREREIMQRPLSATPQPLAPADGAPRVYASKIVCGETDGDRLAEGLYRSVVDIRNAGAQEAVLVLSTVPARGPDRRIERTLAPGEAVVFDCKTVAELAGADRFAGFLVTEASETLDIVVVLTAQSADGHLSIDTARVPASR